MEGTQLLRLELYTAVFYLTQAGRGIYSGWLLCFLPGFECSALAAGILSFTGQCRFL